MPLPFVQAHGWYHRNTTENWSSPEGEDIWFIIGAETAYISAMKSQNWDSSTKGKTHDDVIKWKHFSRYWPFVRGIHRSPVNSPHKGQWRGALMFSLIWVWKDGWVNSGEAGDLKRHRANYDVSVMILWRMFHRGLLTKRRHWLAVKPVKFMAS